MWATAIVLGFLSIPIGVVIRLIPDALVERLVPEFIKRRAQSKAPGLTISDEERFLNFPAEFADIRDELVWLKRFKGGRVNNLKFAMSNPKEVFKPRRSGSRRHSRSNSIQPPQAPTRENSFGSSGGGGGGGAATPDSRERSRSMRSMRTRSRSNSALGAATLMTGIVAGSIGAAGWSPIDRSGDWQQFPAPAPAPAADPNAKSSTTTTTTRAGATRADEEEGGGGASR